MKSHTHTYIILALVVVILICQIVKMAQSDESYITCSREKNCGGDPCKIARASGNTCFCDPNPFNYNCKQPCVSGKRDKTGKCIK